MKPEDEEIKEENDADIEWEEEQYREFQQANWEMYLGI